MRQNYLFKENQQALLLINYLSLYFVIAFYVNRDIEAGFIMESLVDTVLKATNIDILYFV